jgi:hypothetical protein
MSDKTGRCVCCSGGWQKGGASRWGYCSTCFRCAGPTSASWRRRDRIINWVVRWMYSLRSEDNQHA